MTITERNCFFKKDFMNDKKRTAQSCSHCGACPVCDRCDHCGHCRKCGRYVAAPTWPYWPVWLNPPYPGYQPVYIGTGVPPFTYTVTCDAPPLNTITGSVSSAGNTVTFNT